MTHNYRQHSVKYQNYYTTHITQLPLFRLKTSYSTSHPQRSSEYLLSPSQFHTDIWSDHIHYSDIYVRCSFPDILYHKGLIEKLGSLHVLSPLQFQGCI